MLSGILHLRLQIIRILHRLFLRVPDQTGVASEGICDNRLLFSPFHILTSQGIFPDMQGIMLHFAG